MTNTKHTPGPWVVNPIEPCSALPSFSVCFDHGAGLCAVAMVDAVETRTGVLLISAENAEANARLIAAAPETLIALGSAAHALEGVASGFRNQGNQEMYEFYNGKAHEARAAIAKAGGKS